MYQDPDRLLRVLELIERKARQRIGASLCMGAPRADVSYEEYRELTAQEREARRRRFMEAE